MKVVFSLRLESAEERLEILVWELIVVEMASYSVEVLQGADGGKSHCRGQEELVYGRGDN